jgi:hypothetical protein
MLHLSLHSHFDTVLQLIVKQTNQNIHLHNSVTVFILKTFSQHRMEDDYRLHKYTDLIQQT